MEAARTVALVRFHVASGARVCLRAGGLVVGAFVVLAGLSADPSSFLRRTAAGFACSKGSVPLLAAFASALVGLAGWAVPRLTVSLGGWMRHLPAGGAAVRRALALSLFAANVPVLVLGAALWAGAWWLEEGPAGAPGAAGPAGQGSAAGAALVRLAALPVAGLGAAFVVMPARRRWASSPLGVLALSSIVPGSWWALAGGCALLVVADLVAGRVDEPLRTGAASRVSRRLEAPAALVPGAIALRALGLRAFGAALRGVVPMAAVAVFLRNNRLDPTIATASVRLGAGIGIALALSSTAARLAIRRPPWAWSRSLPWSAADRISWDAALLGASTAPVLAMAALLDMRALAPLLLATPFFALRAADAMRRHQESRAGPEPPLFVELATAGAWLGVTAWTSLLSLAFAVPALRMAISAERRIKVSLFHERHHLEVGDPRSSSGG